MAGSEDKTQPLRKQLRVYAMKSTAAEGKGASKCIFKHISALSEGLCLYSPKNIPWPTWEEGGTYIHKAPVEKPGLSTLYLPQSSLIVDFRDITLVYVNYFDLQIQK